MEVEVPERTERWLRTTFKRFRCNPEAIAEFLTAWFTDGHTLDGLNEGDMANFLLARGFMSRAVWEEHRKMCILLMFTNSRDTRYYENLEACARECQVSTEFAREAVEFKFRESDPSY